MMDRSNEQAWSHAVIKFMDSIITLGVCVIFVLVYYHNQHVLTQKYQRSICTYIK